MIILLPTALVIKLDIRVSFAEILSQGGKHIYIILLLSVFAQISAVPAFAAGAGLLFAPFFAGVAFFFAGAHTLVLLIIAYLRLVW